MAFLYPITLHFICLRVPSKPRLRLPAMRLTVTLSSEGLHPSRVDLDYQSLVFFISLSLSLSASFSYYISILPLLTTDRHWFDLFILSRVSSLDRTTHSAVLTLFLAIEVNVCVL
ncbi:unnamed protein product [Protopolystoma xenopodis]|uniref:Uncharacterized protein n=1 Tax=Protopolystoma xenopodis TaxID=117903 RepID=A0A3S5CDF9_9PLAT|nr:unnamed protein product [Protopolystoma xenopodis]